MFSPEFFFQLGTDRRVPNSTLLLRNMQTFPEDMLSRKNDMAYIKMIWLDSALNHILPH